PAQRPSNVMQRMITHKFPQDHAKSPYLHSTFCVTTSEYISMPPVPAIWSASSNRPPFGTKEASRFSCCSMRPGLLLLDLYQINDRTCIHPLKVWQRYSPTIGSFHGCR